MSKIVYSEPIEKRLGVVKEKELDEKELKRKMRERWLVKKGVKLEKRKDSKEFVMIVKNHLEKQVIGEDFVKDV